MHGLRRGMRCFEDPANLRRLGDCDGAAIRAVTARLASADPRARPWLRRWSGEELEQLARLWEAVRMERGDG